MCMYLYLDFDVNMCTYIYMFYLDWYCTGCRPVLACQPRAETLKLPPAQAAALVHAT